ncbi:hypothetical protein Bca52824_053649 [Brassica carinata]|uniref:Uncharacterized protein n=1 Tax=Brassica carinata TaxID=52824 RepID=A0A8X7RC09_BRACI|nr:hypothetical protein Bca52824_053649 [Brassica carinata]
MLNRDDPKAKEDSSSNVGGGETAMVPESRDEANPSTIDKYVAPGTEQTQIEVPTIRAIGGGCNNAESGQAHAYSVEAPGGEALKALEGRLMNAISDGMKEVNKKVKSLSNRLTLVENEVKSLRVSVPGTSELPSEGESDNPSDQDGGDNPSEEDGGDTPSEEDKDGGSKDGSVLAIANQVQSEHEMSAAAEQLESEMLEKAKTEKKKKRRGREKMMENNYFLQKCQRVAIRRGVPFGQDKAGENKQKEAAAEREAAPEKENTCRKNQKTKKGGKKTV